MKVRHWIIITIIGYLLYLYWNDGNSFFANSSQVKFDDLPTELIEYYKNPHGLGIKNGEYVVVVSLDEGYEYEVESVKTFIGPFTSYIKFIDKNRDRSYKLKRGTAFPFVVHNHKLYVPNKYNMFTVVKDLSTIEFTRYDLKK